MSSIVQIHQNRLTNISRSLWTWWLIVTIFWIPLFIFALTNAFNNTTQSVFTDLLLGLLAPFVPYKTPRIQIMETEGIATFVVFVFLMFFASRFINGKGLTFGKQVLLNLLALLFITAVVDLVRGVPFESWTLLFNEVGISIG